MCGWTPSPSAQRSQPWSWSAHATLPHPRNHPDTLSASSLEGAVLLFEYQIAGRGTGVLVTADSNGDRTVFAPAADRTQIAEIAGRTLIEQGATVALISMKESSSPAASPTQTPPSPAASPPGSAAFRAICRSPTLSTLPSPPSATTPVVTSAAIAAASNATSASSSSPKCRWTSSSFSPSTASPPTLSPGELAEWRYQSLSRLHDPVFCGLRCCDGQWLSVIAGRRQPGALVLDWQINLAGLPRYSLCTVMRSFLMEHEIARGTGKLFFEGGTPHSMRHSFACTPVTDILVQRRSAKAWLLRLISQWNFPVKNFLGQTWRDPSLHWTDC